jgi:hypothetical protein
VSPDQNVTGCLLYPGFFSPPSAVILENSPAFGARWIPEILKTPESFVSPPLAA